MNGQEPSPPCQSDVIKSVCVVSDILKAVTERSDKPTGAVLQHLIGAKLQLRFPDIHIGRNAADLHTDYEGDFQVRTTAFHVTTVSLEKLISRCVENNRAGYRPVIFTLENRKGQSQRQAEGKDQHCLWCAQH